MDLGGPELLLILAILAVGVVGLVATVIGVARAARNGDSGWIAGIVVGWFLGFGWIVAIVYLVAVDGPRARDRAGYLATPAPPPPGARPSPAVQPAGWFPDPSGRCDQRYWDGQRWTEHVLRGDVQGTDPL
jgi:hypothetical protein